MGTGEEPCPRQPSLAAVIAAQRDEQVIPHALSRRALEVSRSWFYKWPSDGLAAGSAVLTSGDSPDDGILVLAAAYRDLAWDARSAGEMSDD